MRQHSGTGTTGSGPEQLPGPAACGAQVAQPDVTALRVALPELGLLGGQRVQRPAGGDQPGVGGDPGLGLAEGPVEFGLVTERLGLAPDQRLGPGGGGPGQEVGGAGLLACRDGLAADADLASLLGPPERHGGVRVDGQVPALAAGRAGREVPSGVTVDVLADQY